MPSHTSITLIEGLKSCTAREPDEVSIPQPAPLIED